MHVCLCVCIHAYVRVYHCVFVLAVYVFLCAVSVRVCQSVCPVCLHTCICCVCVTRLLLFVHRCVYLHVFILLAFYFCEDQGVAFKL